LGPARGRGLFSYPKGVRVRLDRLLASQGPWSRKEVKKLIKAGRVRIGERLARRPEEKVNPEAEPVYVDGEPVSYRRHLHLVLHKPPGVLSATRDREEAVATDLLPEALRRRGLGLAGRLDKDAEGLLFLTTDGELAHRLTHPRWKVEKVYEVDLDAPVGEAEVRAFAEGIAGFQPARLEPLPGARARVTIEEGKHHQVKRMFRAAGREVKRLVRTRLGPLALGELAPGEARELTPEEVRALYRAVRLEEG